MGDAFHAGGWGMYPTAIAGFVLVGCAIAYARGPDAARALLVRRLSLLTFLVGVLGTMAGVIKTCGHAATDPDLNRTLVTGLGESLNCVAFAVCSLVIANIATSIGAARLDKSRAELADPHQP